MFIMPTDQCLAPQPVAQDGEKPCLTVKVVLPSMIDSAERAAGFTGLLKTLTALAFERFGAAPETHSPDALLDDSSPSRAGVSADPFDGQPLRLGEADSSHELHRSLPDQKQDSDGSGDFETHDKCREHH